MQKILTEGKLLNKGNLVEAGYSTSTVRHYDRKDIKGKKWRIKEWDYYIVTDGKKAIALTIDDNSYMSLASVSFLDFESPQYKTTSEIKFFSFGKLNFPSCPEQGDVGYNSKRAQMKFVKTENARKLTCKFNDFWDKTPFECEITLSDFPRDQMTIATPFNKRRCFYYNTKINCMKASGYFVVKGKRYDFDENETLGTLDWGRGVWTYKNTWYWSSLQTRLDDGRTFGFNLGYGFGNTSAASENMLFVDGVAHKLDKVIFDIPKNAKGKDDFLSPWKFHDNEGRLMLDFYPILDRKDITDLGILCSKQHQVFGKFCGTVVLDDGSTLQLKNVIGFAEKVFNKW